MVNRLWNHITLLKSKSPLVHNITNYVVMNNTANALLSAGASPVMAHAKSEVEDMVRIAQALVINIGTLDEYWAEAMLTAAKQANLLNKPWILDPVGAGATGYRDRVLQELLKFHPTVIRGNASEIMALTNADREKTKGVDSTREKTKGVDSTAASSEAEEDTKQLARHLQNIVCVSGATDIITNGEKTIHINNGTPLMTKITGMGCTATALIGAFCGVSENKMEATAAAMALLGVSAEIAEESAAGPGSLQTLILDKLYNLSETEFTTRAKTTVS